MYQSLFGALMISLAIGVAGCRGAPAASPGEIVTGSVRAGPTCPVERNPPDPACADRPVAGATLQILDVGGMQVATARSDAAGRFQLRLQPGSYTLVPSRATGLVTTPAPISFTVGTGLATPLLDVSYDTGIR